MAANRYFISLGPFLGLATSLDSRSIPFTRSPNLQNVRVEDGALSVRYGYRNLSGIPSGFSAVYGLSHLEGYGSTDGGITYTLAEEFVAIETRGGNTRPYSIDPTTFGLTEIKNGTSSVALSTGDWRGVAFRDRSYFFNGTTLARHTIGDPTSWATLVQPLPPNAPTWSIGSQQTLSYANTTASTTGTGGTTTLQDSNHWSMQASGNTTGPGTMTIDLGASTAGGAPGPQDWSYQDNFAFSFYEPTNHLLIDPASIVISFVNNNATPLTMTASLTDNNKSVNGTATTINIWSYFDKKISDRVNGLTAVRLATTGVLPSTASAIYNNGTLGVNATLTRGEFGALGNIDGIAATAGMRILVKNQAVSSQNGVYVVTAVGSGGAPWVLTRATDADEAADWATGLKVYPTAGNTLTNLVHNASTATVVVGTTGVTFTAEAADPNHRHQWNNIRKIVIGFTAATAFGLSDGTFVVSTPLLNRIDTSYGWPASMTALNFGYSNYSSSTGIESDIATVSIPRAHWDSERTTPNDPVHNNSTSALVSLSLATPTDLSIDKFRFYYKASDGNWYRIGEQAIATTTFGLQVSDAEAQLLPASTPYSFQQGTILAAAPFNGFMCWCYNSPTDGIRYARLGEPEKQASAADDPTLGDPSFGENFSLADDFGDVAYAAHQAGSSMIFLGGQGVYAHSGAYPTIMGAIHKLPGSKAIAGPLASCRWTDAAGNPGVAYVTPNGEVFFALVSEQFNGQYGFRLIELSEGIRGWLTSYLMTAQSLASFSTVRISVDERTDALWIVMGKRAVVLRRKSEVDGTRQYEAYAYGTDSSGTISYLAFSNRRGMKWIRSTGHFDENEISSATGLPITGSNRDAGNAMPTIYWTSKTFNTPNVYRLDNISVYRDNLANTPSITAASTRQSSTKTLAAGKLHSRFGFAQQGNEHQFTITMSETDSPIRKVTVMPIGPIGTKARS